MIGPGHRSGPTEFETYNASYDAVLSWPAPSLLMALRVLTETAVSITDHKKNPMASVAAFHCVPAKAYEELMDLVNDLEPGRCPMSGPFIPKACGNGRP